ncbi:MAG: hypothetical protein WCA84_09260 [Ignavibacteriaceae bacterium]
MKKDKKNYKRPAPESGEKNIQKRIAIGFEENTFPDYPNYAGSDDIYYHDKEEDLNPEETYKIKKSYKRAGKKNVKKIIEDATDDYPDVRGNELDEMLENERFEDEKNNFYSLGGNHYNDLDEYIGY